MGKYAVILKIICYNFDNNQKIIIFVMSNNK